MPTTFVNGPFPAAGYEALTISNASLGLTAGTIAAGTVVGDTLGGNTYIDMKRMDEALITVEANPIRFRLDGTAPTATEGHLLQPGDAITITGYSNLSRLRFIRQGGSDATLRVTYYRKG